MYVKLTRIDTVQALKRIEMDFLLKDYDKKEVLGIYYDVGEDTISEIPKTAREVQEIQVAIVVHGMLHVETPSGFISPKGQKAWMKEETYDMLF